MTVVLSNSITYDIVKIEISDNVNQIEISTVLTGGNWQMDYKTTSMSDLCSVLQNTNNIVNVLPQNHNNRHVNLMQELIRVCSTNQHAIISAIRSVNVIKLNILFNQLNGILEDPLSMTQNAQGQFNPIYIEICANQDYIEEDESKNQSTNHHTKYHVI